MKFVIIAAGGKWKTTIILLALVVATRTRRLKAYGCILKKLWAFPPLRSKFKKSRSRLRSDRSYKEKKERCKVGEHSFWLVEDVELI